MGWIHHNKPPMGWPIDWDNPLSKGLVGFWLFNEGSGSRVNDLSGNGNTGTIVGPTWASTKYGSGISFDGNTDTINCGKFTGFDGVSAFTIIFTAKWNVLVDGYDVVFSQQVDSTHVIIINGQSTGGIMTFNVSNGSTAYGSTNVFQTVGRYYHIAIVYDGSGAANADRLKLYVDGVYKTFASFTGTIPATVPTLSTVDMTFGYAHASYCFNGIMDNVSIYKNRALTTSEIAQLYREPFCMFEGDLTVAQMYDYSGAPPAPSGQFIMIQMSTIPLFVIILIAISVRKWKSKYSMMT